MEVRQSIRHSFLMTGVCFLLFLGFTVLVSVADVRPVGPEGSAVGLATLNAWAAERIGVHMLWYQITNVLGVVALLTAGCFGLLGLTQLVLRKSLWKVDVQILLLGAFYVLLAVCYLFFEKVIVNFRPVILEGGLEASYPSSHTMLTVCIMATAIMELRRLLAQKEALCRVLTAAAFIVMVVTVIGRLLSGVHWLTDIIGGLLLSVTLVLLYASFVRVSESRFSHKFPTR